MLLSSKTTNEPNYLTSKYTPHLTRIFLPACQMVIHCLAIDLCSSRLHDIPNRRMIYLALGNSQIIFHLTCGVLVVINCLVV